MASAVSDPASRASPVTTAPAEAATTAAAGLNGLDRHEAAAKDAAVAAAVSLRSKSIESLSLDRHASASAKSGASSRDGSIKSSRSGVKKLLPSVGKRKQRKIRDEELRQQAAAADEPSRGRPRLSSEKSSKASRTSKASKDDGGGGDDDDDDDDDLGPLPMTLSPSELDPASSDYLQSRNRLDPVPAMSAVAGLPLPAADPSQSPSPKSRALARPAPLRLDKTTEQPTTTTTTTTAAAAAAAGPDSDSVSGSINARSRSPGRKFRDVFSKAKSPRISSPKALSPKETSPKASPERKTAPAVTSPLSKSVIVLSEEPPSQQVPSVPASPLPPAVTDLGRSATTKSMPTLETRPETPPAATIATPLTTVTPPTPTDPRFDTPGAPPTRTDTDPSSVTARGDNITVSPSGNMISHRRVRSTSSVVHQPSKLANSITASAIPAAIQETRTASGSSTAAATNRSNSGSFFASWMSAAQSAATTLTNLTGPNRSRATTSASDPAHASTTEPIQEETEAGAAGDGDADAEPQAPRKQPAVETMGSGDLNFEHLGLDPGSSSSLSGPSLPDLRHESMIARDVAAAKAEGALAQQAVSAAYGRVDDATPVAELPDPLSNLSSSLQNGLSSGPVIDTDTTSVKRTTSVRSKLATRSSRGSSAAGQSALGVLISGSTATLANPASGPRLTGFTMAPKQRNKSFHQQFRSVPEDDYLIDDYSCALQKDILLAGRLYISEGHICFSSNILGWVTTLIISFDEIVNIERENTALVIPNAIAIQTLHARHTFRSLLSRESTYDLMLGIWRVSHPASFQKSSAGRSQVAREAIRDAIVSAAAPDDRGSERVSVGSSDNEADEDEEDEGDDDDDEPDDNRSAPSTVESAPSVGASDFQDPKAALRLPSGANGPGNPSPPATAVPADLASAMALSLAGAGGSGDAGQDFPGPAAHAPTECTDASTHYEIVIKDEVVPAPLGKVYSLLYGAQSGSFVRKFLVDECKSLDLQLEDDKTGLSNEKKTRQYSYIKPLNGSIGPKQTKCITTEELDFFDLDRAVTVTCSTQTPDVPSGSSFLTKTRYCLTWAAGNYTRLQMNCTVEWSAKSWLKVPIEKGARDGQQQYGDSLVKVLKAHLGRARGMTSTSKMSKTAKKKTKRTKKDKGEADKASTTLAHDGWGPFQPLKPYLGTIVSVVEPAARLEYVVATLFVMVLMLWFSQPRHDRGLSPYGGGLGSSGLLTAERLIAYDQLWRKEEAELWDWLEQRAGVDAAWLQRRSAGHGRGDQAEAEADAARRRQRAKQAERQKILKGKDVEARLREEKMSQREMEEALSLTRDRLDILEQAIRKSKQA